MNIEKQTHFLIHFLYYSLIICLVYIFLRYIIYMIMPFIIGFAIAFILRPTIRRLAKNGHEKWCAFFVILIFYGIFFGIGAWLMVQGFFYIQKWMQHLPSFYSAYIEPYIDTSLLNVQSVWKGIDINTATFFSSITRSLQTSLTTFITNLSHMIVSQITNIMTSIPHILLSFFLAVLSSFFFNSDYQKICNLLAKHLPKHTMNVLLCTQHYIKTTCKHMIKAYMILMCFTCMELWIGLSFLNIEHAFIISMSIAIFDIIPVLGSGGIMLPWALIALFNQQHKLAVGLLILYLIITIIRNIIEPKIVGHQIGLHPLIMLLCMYLGAKLFGILGMFILPFVIIITKEIIQNLESSY